MSKIVKIVICSFVFLLMLLIMIWVIRVVSSNQLDDVSPGISCEKNLIEKSESLAVVPLYRNISIAENKELTCTSRIVKPYFSCESAVRDGNTITIVVDTLTDGVYKFKNVDKLLTLFLLILFPN